MGTPALSREKSDLARRSVAMITKDAVGSPKVSITPDIFSSCLWSWVEFVFQRSWVAQCRLILQILDLILRSLKVVCVACVLQ